MQYFIEYSDSTSKMRSPNCLQFMEEIKYRFFVFFFRKYRVI